LVRERHLTKGKLGLPNLEGDARSRMSTIEITPRSLAGRPRRRGAASLNVCGIAWIVLAATAHRALFHFPTWSSLAVTFLVPGAVQMSR